jgi:hypothetical protein
MQDQPDQTTPSMRDESDGLYEPLRNSQKAMNAAA